MAAQGVAPVGAGGPNLPQAEIRPNGEHGQFGTELLDMLRQAMVFGNQSIGRDIVVLIGPTGSGKSTMLNALHRKRLVGGFVNGQFRIDVHPDDVAIATIGHNRVHSETLYARAYHEDGLPFTYVDSGGFRDTRGPVYQVVNAVAMKIMLENARTVRIGVCYDSNGIEIRRGGDLCDLLIQVYDDLLVGDYRLSSRSIALILTKPRLSVEGWYHTEDDPDGDARATLQGYIDDALPGGEQQALFQFILREGGRYLKTYRPLHPDRPRERLEDLFRDMEGITEPRGKFNVAYSAETLAAMTRGVTQIVLGGIGLLDGRQTQIEAIGRHNGALAELNQQITRLQNAAQRLDTTRNSVAEIAQAKQELIQQQQQIVQTQNAAIEGLQGQVAEKDAAIEAVRARLAQWDREAIQEIEYWSQGINQKGIPGVKGSTVTTKTSTRGFLGIGGKTTVTTTTLPDIPGKSHERDFEYRGPKYIRVEKTGEGSWIGEVESPDKTSYKIHYSSGEGKDANASIRVIIAKGDDPQEQHKRIELTTEQTQLVQEKAGLNAQIATHLALRNQAQNIIVAAQCHVNELEGIRAQIAELETARGALNQTIAEAHAAREDLERQITAREADFQFLNDYLRLSQDEHVARQPLIVQFLEKYRLYQQPAPAQ